MTSLGDTPRVLRRDSRRTKQRILDAAVDCFATRGFATTGMRDIAAQAGVNPSLIVRYFGTKEALYDAAIYARLDVSSMVAERAGFGAELAERLSRHGSEPALSTSMLVLGSADPASARIAIAALKRTVLGRMAVWIEEPDASLRAMQISLLATGFLVYTKLLPIVTPEDPEMAGLADWLGESIQRIVDQPLVDAVQARPS